jgi:hypothetical protein
MKAEYSMQIPELRIYRGFTKSVFILLLLISIVLFNSCEQNVDPKAPFKERYILNLIIRGDTSYQIATLSHSYTVSGINPLENKTDPTIQDADIRIWYNDNVFKMRDTSIIRQDTSRYNTPANFYYLKGFKPGGEAPVEVRVELNNGRILTATTTTPGKIDIDSADLSIPSSYKSNFSYVWKNTNNGIYYIYRFRFYYTISEGSTVIWHYKEVPLTYIKSGSTYVPYFPSVSKNTSVLYENSCLDSAMIQISRGDGNKSKYEIKRAEFEIIIFDKALSDYYSVTHGYLDEYSIRLDENDFTNINGGFGIFASYLNQKIVVKLTEKYVRSFGYRYGF